MRGHERGWQKVHSAFCPWGSSSRAHRWGQNRGQSLPQNHAKGIKRILLMKYMYKSCMSALVITAFGHRVNHTSEANGNKAGVEFERCFVDFREMEFNHFDVGHSLWECRTDHYIILPFGLEGVERARVHQASQKRGTPKTPGWK